MSQELGPDVRAPLPVEPLPDSHNAGGKRRIPGWVVSLLIHALIVGLLSLLTLSVPPSPEPSPGAAIEIGPAVSVDGTRNGSGAGGAAPGAPSPPPSSNPTPELPIPVPVPSVSVAADSADDAAELRRSETSIPVPDLAVPSPQDISAALRPDPAAIELSGSGFDLAGTGAGEVGTGATGRGLGAGTSDGFQREVGAMGRQGLDLVIVLDTTSSMEPWLRQARQRLGDVITVLEGVLNASADDPIRRRSAVRYGVVAFKDYGDFRGLKIAETLPLTDDPDEVQRFLGTLRATGGGDLPEPIDEALRLATDDEMAWQRGRRQMILLVGDAPIHLTGRRNAIRIADDFSGRRRGGRISVLDVGGAAENAARTEPLPDFQDIARAGGGEAFVLEDQDAFWRSFVSAVFGERFAADVRIILDNHLRLQEIAP